MSVLNERGHEVPDATPVAMPVGFRKPESLQDQIQRLVRNELSARAASQGMETFEEADDFDVGDDDGDNFRSKHELDDEQERFPTPKRARLEIDKLERGIAKRRKRWGLDEEFSAGYKSDSTAGEKPKATETEVANGNVGSSPTK